MGAMKPDGHLPPPLVGSFRLNGSHWLHTRSNDIQCSTMNPERDRTLPCAGMAGDHQRPFRGLRAIHEPRRRIHDTVGSIDPDAVEYIPPEAASTYTKLAAAYGGPYYRSLADKVVPELEPGDRLLDAGTGPGFLPILLAERLSNVQIHAFDFTRELVTHGHKESVRRGVDDRVSFFTADITSIPIRASSYPWITCNGVLHSLDAPSEAIAEFYRVLEPGGTAWVTDPTILDPPDELDIELTTHEREVFEAYGVQSTSDQSTISRTDADRLVAESPFTDATIEEGEYGDIRLWLTRLE